MLHRQHVKLLGLKWQLTNENSVNEYQYLRSFHSIGDNWEREGNPVKVISRIGSVLLLRLVQRERT